MGIGSRSSLRGPSGISSNAAFFIVISCLSSFYVIGRLWSSSTEVSYLKQEINKLTELAQQQREYLEKVDSEVRETDTETDEAPFYSVRPAPLEIPPLNGSSLPDDTPIEDSSFSSPSTGQVVGEIDSIEAGTITGWACNLPSSKSKQPPKILIYVNDHLVAETTASISTTLPQVVLHICHSNDPLGTKKPFGFSAELPPLPPTQHELRAFIVLPDRYVELYHSPATFIESTIKPNAEEIIRRKDAIIVRRNAELASLWQEVRSYIQWKHAENAAMLQQAKEEDDGSRLLATILVHSDPRDIHMRNLLRKTWMPGSKKAAQKLLQDQEMVVKFIMGPPGELQRKQVEKEIKDYDDILIITHQESLISGSKKLLGALELVTETLDSDFYVVTRDTVVVNLEAVSNKLSMQRNFGNAYLGCFKSGQVGRDAEGDWFEPDHYRFGEPVKGNMQYPRHALGEFYVLSRPIARYLARNSAVMSNYAFEDTTVGAWMLGLNVDYGEDNDFCCNTLEKCASKDGGADSCLAFFDTGCSGICQASMMLERVYKRCIQKNGN